VASPCLLDTSVILDAIHDLRSLEFYPVTWDIAKFAGSMYREWRQKGLTLALPDLTVAAVAIANGLPLMTDNRKDFPMPELRLCPLP